MAGRPKGSGKRLDEQRLRALATIGCTNMQIGEAMGVSHDTLSRRYREVIAQARGSALQKILAKTYQLAAAGNVRCLELCLINRAGWALRPELVVNVTQNTGLAVSDETKQKLRAIHDWIRAESAVGNAPDGFCHDARLQSSDL